MFLCSILPARVIQRAYKLYLPRRAMLAFAMGAHHRLGPAENLNVDVVVLGMPTKPNVSKTKRIPEVLSGRPVVCSGSSCVNKTVGRDPLLQPCLPYRARSFRPRSRFCEIKVTEEVVRPHDQHS